MTTLPQQSLAAIAATPNVMEVRRLDIMGRQHTHSFSIEESGRSLAAPSGEAGALSIHAAMVPGV